MELDLNKMPPPQQVMAENHQRTLQEILDGMLHGEKAPLHGTAVAPIVRLRAHGIDFVTDNHYDEPRIYARPLGPPKLVSISKIDESQVYNRPNLEGLEGAWDFRSARAKAEKLTLARPNAYTRSEPVKVHTRGGEVILVGVQFYHCNPLSGVVDLDGAKGEIAARAIGAPKLVGGTLNEPPQAQHNPFLDDFDKALSAIIAETGIMPSNWQFGTRGDEGGLLRGVDAGSAPNYVVQFFTSNWRFSF